jgi:glycerol-3-phosphate cytidylyltransferase
MQKNKKYYSGFIAGSFDVIHPGYIKMFKEAKQVCKNLIVALQDDPTIDRPEKCKPVQSWSDRREILESIRYVDKVLYYCTEQELFDLLKSTPYDVRILGSDYIGKQFTGDDLGKSVHYCERSHTYSTTDLKKRIASSMQR